MKKDGIQTRKRKPKSMGGGHGVPRPGGGLSAEAHSHKVLPPLYAGVECAAGPLLLLPAARHQTDAERPREIKCDMVRLSGCRVSALERVAGTTSHYRPP
ncbi:hypothetical protein RR46_02376 [Papilio xuthus]|uniref:Uncharacterized protein n=1 Tax=Papilio xuthus TaxID=66420 RepID=A0A194Q2D5_PAPXU|nr:hypothetical protein RR46_02376 [Papilio xuthus]